MQGHSSARAATVFNPAVATVGDAIIRYDLNLNFSYFKIMPIGIQRFRIITEDIFSVEGASTLGES